MSQTIKNSLQIAHLWPIVLIGVSVAVSLESIKQGTAVLIAGICLEVGLRLLRKSERRRLEFNLFDLFVAICVILELVAYRQSTFLFNSRPFLEVVLNTVVMYYFLRLTFRSADSRSVLMAIGALFALYWSILTIAGALQMSAGLESSGFSDLAMFRNEYTPMYGSNEWVVFLLLLLPFAVAMLVSAKRIAFRIIGGITLALIAVSVALGFSRGGYAGLILFSTFLIVGLLVFRFARLKHIAITLGAILVIVASATIGHWDSIKTTLMVNETVSQSRSSESRFRMWEVAQEVWADYPMFGVGDDNFAFEYNARHEMGFDEAPFGRVTSLLTKLAAEKGALGLLVPAVLAFLFFLYGLQLINDRNLRAGPDGVFVLACMALIPALLVRELTMSTILHREFIYQLLIIEFGLFALIAGRAAVDRPWNVTRILLLVVPLLTLSGTIGYYHFKEKKLYQNNRQLKKAIEGDNGREQVGLIETMVEIEPDHPMLHALLASAKTMCPGDANVNWSNLLVCDGNPEDALSSIAEAVNIESRDETLQFAKGWYLAGLAQYDDAIPLLEEAIRMDRTQFVYSLALGVILEKRDGHATRAARYYGEAIALDPDLCVSEFFRELVQRDTLASREAVRYAMDLLDIDDPGPVITARLGALNYFIGAHQAAKTMLEDALDDLPGMNRPYFYLGAMQMEAGDTVKGLELWDKSIYLDSEDLLVYESYNTVATRLAEVTRIPIPEDAMYRVQTEPLYWKRRPFYLRFKPHENTVLSKGVMMYIAASAGLLNGEHLSALQD